MGANQMKHETVGSGGSRLHMQKMVIEGYQTVTKTRTYGMVGSAGT